MHHCLKSKSKSKSLFNIGRPNFVSLINRFRPHYFVCWGSFVAHIGNRFKQTPDRKNIEGRDFHEVNSQWVSQIDITLFKSQVLLLLLYDSCHVNSIFTLYHFVITFFFIYHSAISFVQSRADFMSLNLILIFMCFFSSFENSCFTFI